MLFLMVGVRKYRQKLYFFNGSHGRLLNRFSLITEVENTRYLNSVTLNLIEVKNCTGGVSEEES